MTTGRLFVAVWPPAAVLAEIERIPPMVDPGTRLVRRDQWHVTLSFLGTVEIDPAVAAFERIAFAPCEAGIGPQVEMLGRSIVVLPVAGLDDVAAAVRRHLPGDDDRAFHGHLTLARQKSRQRSAMVGIPFEAHFAVCEIALVQSAIARDGARYETIAVRMADG